VKPRHGRQGPRAGNRRPLRTRTMDDRRFRNGGVQQLLPLALGARAARPEAAPGVCCQRWPRSRSARAARRLPRRSSPAATRPSPNAVAARAGRRPLKSALKPRAREGVDLGHGRGLHQAIAARTRGLHRAADLGPAPAYGPRRHPPAVPVVAPPSRPHSTPRETAWRCAPTGRQPPSGSRRTSARTGRIGWPGSAGGCCLATWSPLVGVAHESRRRPARSRRASASRRSARNRSSAPRRHPGPGQTGGPAARRARTRELRPGARGRNGTGLTAACSANTMVVMKVRRM